MPSRRSAAATPSAGPSPVLRLPATAKGRAMRARLVAAAVECFTTRGYHATAVAEITGVAGTSHGNFYRYFGNVDDILLCAVEAPLARLLVAGRRPQPSDCLSLAAVERWQQDFLAAYLPDRALLAIMREAAAIDRAGRFVVAWRGLRGRFVREIERWIVDVEAALGPDPDGLTPATLAETLGAMGEQVAYVNLGLARSEPDPATVATLGQAVALTYHRAVVRPRGQAPAWKTGTSVRSSSIPGPSLGNDSK